MALTSWSPQSLTEVVRLTMPLDCKENAPQFKWGHCIVGRLGCSIAYVDGLQLARVGRGAGNIPDVLGRPLCGGGADRGREDQEDDRGDGGGGIHGGSCTDESGSVVNCDAAFILWSGGTVHLLSQA